MAITFPLNLPSATQFTRVEFEMLDAVGENESPFTFQRETQEHAGKRWLARVEIIRLDRAGAEAWIAFLASLNGRKGSFLMGDPMGATPRGIATGTPLVKGASQVGQSLVTDGWTAGQTGILKAGDYLQLGSGSTARLHKVLQDADSDGSGNATFDLWPGMATAPADNAPITVTSAVGVWALAGNRRGWSVAEAIKYGISFEAKSVV